MQLSPPPVSSLTSSRSAVSTPLNIMKSDAWRPGSVVVVVELPGPTGSHWQLVHCCPASHCASVSHISPPARSTKPSPHAVLVAAKAVRWCGRVVRFPAMRVHVGSMNAFSRTRPLMPRQVCQAALTVVPSLVRISRALAGTHASPIDSLRLPSTIASVSPCTMTLPEPTNRPAEQSGGFAARAPVAPHGRNPASTAAMRVRPRIILTILLRP